MAQTNERLDLFVLGARCSAEKMEQGYRAQALKLFPWVCARCAPTFDHAKLKDMGGRSDGGNAVPTASFKAFADLKAMLASGQRNAQ